MSEEDTPYFAHSVEIASCDQQVVEAGATFDASCVEEEPAEPTPFEFEDGYADYIDDTFGYAHNVWDRVSAGRQSHHDAILAMDAEALGELDAETLEDLERFALARAWRRLGRADAFLSVVDRILQEPREDASLNYDELETEALRWALVEGHGAWAESALERLRERAPSSRAVTSLTALQSATKGEWVDAMRSWEAAVAADAREAEACLEVAETLIEMGETVRAQGWIERAETTARADGDRALLVDIALCRERV